MKDAKRTRFDVTPQDVLQEGRGRLQLLLLQRQQQQQVLQQRVQPQRVRQGSGDAPNPPLAPANSLSTPATAASRREVQRARVSYLAGVRKGLEAKLTRR